MPSTDYFYKDPRFQEAIDLFNSQEWYLAHDAFEDLWHETAGVERNTLQAILQVAVAQLHLERGNTNGALILFGEALGRINNIASSDLGLELDVLVASIESIVSKLQNGQMPDESSLPLLKKKPGIS